MKKLSTIMVALSMLTTVAYAGGEEEMQDVSEVNTSSSSEYSSRTLRARQARTTGSPAYADEELKGSLKSADSIERMEDSSTYSSGFSGRTYKSNKAMNTSNSY